MSTKTMKLSQVIALETDAKQRIQSAVTKIHKAMQKADLYNGSTATYEATREGEEEFPSKKVKVRLVAETALAEMAEHWVELVDWTAAKDFGNCSSGARADVIVDGVTLVEQAPVPLLLFLEKQMTDLRKSIDVTPTLDEAEDWVFDDRMGYHRTAEPVKTHKTKKLQKGLVLHPPTVEHPAQTQMITEDVVVGYWTGNKFSGALTPTRKRSLLKRTNTLLGAIKVAREEANHSKVDTQNIGDGLYKFVLGQTETS